MAYVSRAMTPTEQRYAQIEKEALAITWSCDRFNDYLMDLEFRIETDHKPLVPLFGTKQLDELPLRVQRFRMRLMRYRFTIYHVPGKSLITADALSRALASDPNDGDHLLRDEVEAYVDIVIPATEKRLDEIRTHQDNYEIIRQMMTFCQKGWPEKEAIPEGVRPCYSVASEMSVENGILMRGSRVVIPASLRASILDKLHEGHQGITKSRERAKQSVWWPQLSQRLEETVRNCTICYKHKPTTVEPLTFTSTPLAKGWN